MSAPEGPTGMDETTYAQALAEEGAYWDNFIAQQLLRGEMPGSADRRLAATHYRYQHRWRPICFGPREANYRMQEIYDLISAADRPGLRILDLGCGAGWLSLELARRGAHVTGVDISPANLELARYMAETNTRNFPFLYQKFVDLPCRLEDFGSATYMYGDLNTLSLPPEEYDLVVVWDSLHHVADLERLFEQIRRTLKPQGRFIGVDHAFATPRTEQFNLLLMAMIDDFYKSITETDPWWLYAGTDTVARQHEWGLLAVDYDPTPIPDAEAFFKDLFAEMLAALGRGLQQEALEKAHRQAQESPAQPGTGAESPFEDVSAQQVIQTIVEHFAITRFSTGGPFIMPELHIPHYRNEPERIFQHYLVAALVVLGEHAIAKDHIDGQWFFFETTKEHPTHPLPQIPILRGHKKEDPAYLSQLEAELMRRGVVLSDRLIYIRHLETELARKNQALTDLESRLQQREQELVKARTPKLPWKRRGVR